MLNLCIVRLRLKCDDTHAETRFRLSPKRTSPFKSAGTSVQSTTGSRGVPISGSNAGYTSSRVSVRVLTTHSIHQFPLHFPSRASPRTIRFQMHSTFPSLPGYNSWNKKHPQLHNGCMAVSGTQQALLSFMLRQHDWLPHELNHTFIVSCHSSGHCCSCCHSSCIIHRDDCLAAISTGWF